MGALLVALGAQLVSGSHVRVRSPEERERAFLRAEQHSRIVGILRKTLPVLALLILASYFISSRMNVTVGGVTASVNGLEVKDGNLRMVNPRLKGRDKKNGAYVISAEYADQDMKNPKLIKLHAIKAELTTQSKGWSRLQAVRGRFNTESERLVMQEDIRVATSSGITGKLTHASLEMDSQTLRSHQPVAFDLPNGTVRARAMTLSSDDHTLVFRGKVVVHINKSETKQASAENSQAQPPPQVKAPEAPSRVAPEPGEAAPLIASPQ